MSGVSIVCIGPSHKTASLAARERFALVGASAHELTSELLQHADVLEVVPVATCNRSELYLAVTDVGAVLPVAVAAFARLANADPEEMSTMIAVRSEQQAAEHLFRVAAGAESVVLGEAQIQGQLKEALTDAHERGTCGPLLDRLFRQALEVGKLVRTRTTLGEGHASVGSVAAELVCRRLGSLEHRDVLLIGAGRMSALAAASLSARGARQVFVANRNAARAAHLAERFRGSAVPLERLDDELVRCDVVLSCTSAPHLMLTRERVQRVLERRGGRPIVLVDLAVPRDIEAAAGELPGCHLYDLDDLEHSVAHTLQQRESELAQVTELVHGAAVEFTRWRQELDAVPAITSLRRMAEQVRRSEFERFERRLGHLAAEDRRRVEQLTRGIVNKLLHHPTVRLRESASATSEERADHEAWTLAVEQLFGLESIEG